jgi:hypothetical protein
VWVCTFLAFVAAGTAWSLAQPLLSTADEGQHFLEAQAVWSGQFTPKLVPDDGPMKDGLIRVHNLIGALDHHHGFRCFNGYPDISAKCDTRPLTTTTREVDVGSYVAREPPVPAILDGLPSALDPDRTGFVLSRLLDSVITAAALATAIAMCLRRRRPLLAAGVVIALTPCGLAEAGAIGSSQTEVAAAILTWTAVALLVTGETVRARFVLVGTLAATIFVLSRPVSLLWAALAALVIVAASNRARLREILTSWVAWIGIVVLVAASAAAGLWAVYLEAPATPNTRFVRDQRIPHGIIARIGIVLGSVHSTFPSMIGDTGGSYHGPWWTIAIWIALTGAVLLAGIALAPARLAVTIVGLVIAGVGVSFAFQVRELAQLGYFWHGRYDLPTFAGIVILAAAPLDAGVAQLPRLARLSTVVVVGAAAAQILELGGALRRFTVGLEGTVNPFGWHDGWHPPISAVVLLGVGAAVLAGTYASLGVWMHLARPPSATPTEAPGVTRDEPPGAAVTSIDGDDPSDREAAPDVQGAP